MMTDSDLSGPTSQSRTTKSVSLADDAADRCSWIGPAIRIVCVAGDVRQVDVFLINNHAVQIDHPDVARQCVESVHNQRVGEQGRVKRLQARTEFGDGRMIRQTGLVFLERPDVFVGSAPLFSQRAFILRFSVDRLMSHETQKPAQGWPADQVDVVIDDLAVCHRDRLASARFRLSRLLSFKHRDVCNHVSTFPVVRVRLIF